jgi:hypothetical protein
MDSSYTSTVNQSNPVTAVLLTYQVTSDSTTSKIIKLKESGPPNQKLAALSYKVDEPFPN